MDDKLKSVLKKKQQEKKLRQIELEQQLQQQETSQLRLYQNESVKKRCMAMHVSNDPIINYDIKIEYEGVPTLVNMEDEHTTKFNHDQLDDLQITLSQKSIFNFKSNNNILYRNIYKNIRENTSLIEFENLLDNEWMSAQFKYIAELDKKDLFTIYSYTRVGDEWANTFLRKKFVPVKFISELLKIQNSPDTYRPYFPLFLQAYYKINDLNLEQILEIISKDTTDEKKEVILNLFLDKSVNLKLSEIYIIFLGLLTCFTMDFWLEIIGIYVKDIDRIIKNAPEIKKKMYVYRGIGIKGGNTDRFLSDVKNHIKSLNGFESTSLSVKMAFEFTSKTCCLQRITLLPGVKALLISCVSAFSTESEILLGHNTNYYVMDHTTKINKSMEVCVVSGRPIETLDIVMIGNDYPSTYCPKLAERECAKFEKCLWHEDKCQKK